MTEIIKFKSYTCKLELGLYYNNQLALSLINACEDLKNDLFIGEPIAKATVNIPEINLKDNEILIKIHSENEGMLEALQKSGYVSDLIQYVQSEFVKVALVNKTDKLMELEKTFRKNLPQVKKNKY